MKVKIEKNGSDEEVQCVICDMALGAEALQVFAYEDGPDGWQLGVICDQCLRKGPEGCAETLRKEVDGIDGLLAEGAREQANQVEASGPWPTLRDLEAAWETSDV